MLTLNLNLLYTVVNVLILFLLLRKFLVQACYGDHRTASETGG